MSLTRRDFVGGAVSLAALVGLGGASAAFASGQELLRPPGGQDEGALLGACVRCDRCRSVCPTNCIGVSKVDDGLVEVRTPKMDYHKGYCTFCMRCQDVCPTQALSPAVWGGQQGVGCAQVQRNRCVAWRNPGSCRVCVDVCPYGALSVSDGVPVVDAGVCNGCGECELRCPALSMLSLQEGSDRGIVVRAYDQVAAQGTTVDGGSV